MDRNGRTALPRPLIAILIAGLAIRLPFGLIDPYFSGDVRLLADWADALVRGGPAELVASTGNMVLYPPLATLAIWLAGIAGPAFDGLLGPQPGTVLMVKLPGIAGDIGLAWIVGRLLVARPWRVAAVAAAAIAFNPALWYLSAVWGQVDSVYALLMVASVAALRSAQPARSWLAWSAATAWKLQALPLAPLVLARTLRMSGVAGAARGAFAAGALWLTALGVLLVEGASVEYVQRLWHAESSLVISAFNAWYLIGAFLQPGGGLGDVLAANGALLGYGSVGAIAAIVVGAVWRRPDRTGVALPALALTIGVFVLLVAVRERYLLAALPFAVLLAAGWETGQVSRAGILAAVALTATYALNLAAVNSFAPSAWINVFAPVDTGPLGPAISAAGYAAATVNVAVLAWSLKRLISPRPDLAS